MGEKFAGCAQAEPTHHALKMTRPAQCAGLFRMSQAAPTAPYLSGSNGRRKINFVDAFSQWTRIKFFLLRIVLRFYDPLGCASILVWFFRVSISVEKAAASIIVRALLIGHMPATPIRKTQRDDLTSRMTSGSPA